MSIHSRCGNFVWRGCVSKIIGELFLRKPSQEIRECTILLELNPDRFSLTRD